LKQNISKDCKDGAVTYYPHGLQPNMHSSCAVWSITFHIYVQSNLFVLAMYFDTVSNTNLPITLHYFKEPSWSWSYGRWIYNYLCNQCLSSIK